MTDEIVTMKAAGRMAFVKPTGDRHPSPSPIKRNVSPWGGSEQWFFLYVNMTVKQKQKNKKRRR